MSWLSIKGKGYLLKKNVSSMSLSVVLDIMLGKNLFIQDGALCDNS